jgi:hypothetical protein
VRQKLRNRVRSKDPEIRHKLRGLRIGAPLGSNGQAKDSKELVVFVKGKPDYHRDAYEIFSFLFVNVPHGTMQALMALIGTKLDWVDRELAARVARLPQHPTLNRRTWGDEPVPPPEELPQLDLFDNPQ